MNMMRRQSSVPAHHVLVYVDCHDREGARRALRSLASTWSDTMASLELRFLADGGVRVGAWSRMPGFVEETLRQCGAVPHRA